MAGTTGSNEQCVIVMVKASHSCCCCDLKLDVPTNYTVLEEVCGRSTGVMPAGAQFCYCCHKRIACMLTKNTVGYDAPVKGCPTKDNAYVDVDIFFNFRLPTTEDLVKVFVYKLGAGRFDELLQAEVEEGLRNFINSIWLNQVFDLKSDMAMSLMDGLNRKFARYGIVFENCSVKNVNVNAKLFNALNERTKLKFDLRNHIKDQENKRLKLENEEAQNLTDLQRKNERAMYELKQEIERAKVDKEQSEIEAHTKLTVAVEKAKERASVMITKAEGQQQIVVN